MEEITAIMTKKVNFIYKVMILTTYMSADTIRNIQNGVNKRKKIHQNAVKKGKKKTKNKGEKFYKEYITLEANSFHPSFF